MRKDEVENQMLEKMEEILYDMDEISKRQAKDMIKLLSHRNFLLYFVYLFQEHRKKSPQK